MKKVILSIAFGLTTMVIASSFARADAVLVPEFRTDAGWTTLVTVIDTYATTGGIHWMYRWDDPLTLAVNECGHTDATGASTANDMGTTNVGVPPVGFGNTPAMFGDVTTTALTIGPGFKGLITLYNFIGSYDQFTGAGTLGSGPENSLEAVIHEINFTTGEVQSIRAPNDPIGITEGNLDDMAWGASPANSLTQVLLAQPKASWLPTSIVTTSWEIIVPTLNTAFDVPPANTVTLSLSGSAYPVPAIPLIYDIDENPLSGVISVTVNCFGRVFLSDFLTPLNLSLVANGGWAYINMAVPFGGGPLALAIGGPPAPNPDRGILVYKEETATIGGSAVTTKTSANRIDF